MSEDAEFQKRLLNQLSSVLDGMKTLNERISGNMDSMARYDAEFANLTRQNSQLRSDILGVKSELTHFRTETVQRLQALSRRIDEIENFVDDNYKNIHEMRTELRGQYKDIMTAIPS
ncbi:MAG: hypothetical protein ACK4SQ_10490 [Allorhizobium sp.]